MMLQRMVRKVLPVFREHHTVDLRRGTFADECDLLVYFGQLGSQGSNRPLQGRVATDERFLMREVVGLVTPLLQIDIAEM